MALYDLPNATTGLDDILVETATEVPSLAPLLFVFIYFVVLLGGSSLQARRVGKADTAMWSVIASIAVLIIALLMSVISGIIKQEWLIISLVIAILSGFWLFLDRQQSEI